MSERSIFLTALEKDSPDERASYLDDACAGDTVLRQRVEALLQSHQEAGNFLQRPALQGAAAGQGHPSATQTEPGGGPGGDLPLDFLDPSDHPGSRGRLGHYEVVEVIGQGGFGVVFKALDPALNRLVAIKVLAPQLASSVAARKRFAREAKAAAAVSHEHVVAIHAVEEAKGLPYLVMEYVAGVSLQERLDRSGPQELAEVLRIGMQAAQGLAAAHAQGLVHRDVKPANILLHNGVERVKITDFGLARAADDASLTQSGVVAGTPQYMAPEQARGEAVDHRADLFSLGSVLYALCTGRPPFRASTTLGVLRRVTDDTPRPVHEVNPEMPAWMGDIIARLHAKDPAQRLQSAGEVAELLGQCLAHVQQPGRAPLPARLKRPRSVLKSCVLRAARAGALWGIICVVGGLLLAGAFVGLAFSRFGEGWFYGSSAVTPDAIETHVPKEEPAPPPAVADPAAGWAEFVNPAGDCAVAQEKGRVTITVPGTHHNLNPLPEFNNLSAPRLLQEVEGDFVLQARVLPFPRPEANTSSNGRNSFVGAGLVVWLDGKNFVRFVRGANGETGRLVVTIEHYQEGHLLQEHSINIADQATDLRVERHESSFRFLVHSDIPKGEWTEIPTRPKVKLPAKLKVGLLAVNSTTKVFAGQWEQLRLTDPVTKTDPFLVLPRAGGKGRVFSTLPLAVAAAGEGDTIEVCDSGPFVTDTITVNKRLTIRPGEAKPGEAAWPILRLSEAGVAAGEPLLRNTAPLVLEGLHLELANGRPWAPELREERIVIANGAPLYAANCRFVISRQGKEQHGLTAVRAIEPPVCVLRNCLFLQAEGVLLGMGEPPRGGRVLVENCLVRGAYGIALGSSGSASADAHVTLAHNTIIGRVPLVLHLYHKPPPGRADDAAHRAYHIESVENVFRGGMHLNQQFPDGDALPAAEAEAALRRLVDYREERNLHSLPTGLDFLVLTRQHEPMAATRKRPNLADWEQFWSLHDTGSIQAEVKLRGEDPLWRNGWTGFLGRADYDLTDKSPGRGAGKGGRNLGADGDLAGDGPGYRDWKRTPAYQQWLQETGQVEKK
jgi:hypothetical protein